MSKKKRNNPGRAVRDAPTQSTSSGAAFLTSVEGWNILCGSGYKPVWKCPEVQMCIGVFADLIGIMTLRLMRNGEHGDERVKNALSYKLDVNPSRYMTRITFIQTVVRILMTFGNCAVYPKVRKGLLEDLQILPPGSVSYMPDEENGYIILYQGKKFKPDEIVHFVLNPDLNEPWRGTGYTVCLRDAVDGLRQGEATKNALLSVPHR